MTKTIPPTQNSWKAFVENVKLLMSSDSVLSKKDYSKMMAFYITGKSAENYFKENMK